MSSKKILMAPVLLAVALGSASVAHADIDPRFIIDGKYLPWGAEVAGNASGTIPAFTGNPGVPASYDPSKPGVRPDPFAAESPILVINKENMHEHANNLAEGIKDMLALYPDYQLNVYSSHRTANYPDLYMENSLKNIDSCKTVNDGLGLEGCYAGLPFPFPETGNEVMWNRLLKYDQHASITNAGHEVVARSGPAISTGSGPMYKLFPIFAPDKTGPMTNSDVYSLFRTDWDSPSRKAGEITLVTDSLDMVNVGRRAWSYMPGQRRVKLAPDLSYDTPGPAGAGLLTMDDSTVFWGALDRYDFKLIGKKEIYMPYNAYKAANQEACPLATLLSTRQSVNPECMRWELHRVWVVEATVKPTSRHIYPKRIFYWDEDLTGVGIAANYDSAGSIYRVIHGTPVTAYEGKGHFTDAAIYHDLQAGAYVWGGGSNVITEPKDLNFFTPAALTRSGIR